MYCPNCGKKLEEDNLYCPVCGLSKPKVKPNSSEENQQISDEMAMGTNDQWRLLEQIAVIMSSFSFGLSLIVIEIVLMVNLIIASISCGVSVYAWRKGRSKFGILAMIISFVALASSITFLAYYSLLQ